MIILEVNKIYNESCFDTIKNISNESIDLILTSPFYNTNKKQGKTRTLQNTNIKGYSYIRYDTHLDNMTDKEYNDFTVNLFNDFDKILKPNGVILYNLSYGNNNREGFIKAIYSIINRTNFTIADLICWKKKSALPNNCSPNKLTRIFELIFVISRKSEIDSFYCNKNVVSIRKTGQKSYENIFNFIEAKNNDETCPYNKATFSSELVEKLLKIYCPKNGLVYDPFMGSGTTGVGCKKYGSNYIGSEISKNQVSWANNRISNI